MIREAILVASLSLLAACGSGSGDEETQVGEMAGTDNAVPGAEPAAASPGIDCSKARGQTAPDGAQTDDILGIRPGMSEAAVMNVLSCNDAHYALDTRRQKMNMPPEGSISVLTVDANSGLDEVKVFLTGPENDERVIQVGRKFEYLEGQQPQVATILDELAAKYGTFDKRETYHQSFGYIILARNGQRLTENVSAYDRCDGHNFNISWTHGMVLPCGTVVSYQLDLTPPNNELVRDYSVSVIDYAVADQMETVTKAAIEKQKEEERKKAEEAAGQSGSI